MSLIPTENNKDSNHYFGSLAVSEDLLICKACGTQFDVTQTSGKKDCKICDDPRQFVPAEGQAYTTLAEMKRDGYRNKWTQDAVHPEVWSVKTTPSFAIGQRALFIQTEQGILMWDMIAYLDQETVDEINSRGGLKAILISHPHYYTTVSDWAATFPNTTIIIGAPDKSWLSRSEPSNVHWLSSQHEALPSLSDLTVILSGGHFPGSLCLHWAQKSILFIADTIFTSYSATNPVPGKPGVISFTWWYSVPNRIPLGPSQIWSVWKSVADLDFHTTLGAFEGMEVREGEEEIVRGTGGVKGRMRESMRIFITGMGWTGDEGGEEGEAARVILGND